MKEEKGLARVPTNIDAYAGERLKILRKEKGLTQKELANLVGITFQQVQKYEKGVNRIGVSRLYAFCKALGVMPSYFFENINFENNEYSLGKVAESDNISIITELLFYFRQLSNEDKSKIISDIKALLKDKKIS